MKLLSADGSLGSPHVRVGHREALIPKTRTEMFGFFFAHSLFLTIVTHAYGSDISLFTVYFLLSDLSTVTRIKVIVSYTYKVLFFDKNTRTVNFRTAAIFIIALLVNMSAQAEVNVNGFGSLFAGRVTEGNEFLADYPKTGIYDNDWSFTPDSTLGIQFSSYFTDEFSFIAQIVANSASDSTVDVDWLYLNYHISSELSVQLGRKRLPLYYYSDYFDVGYAYYWIRPPADLYTWQITNYNGISLLYEKNLGDWDGSINLYYGNEESEDNQLLGLLFGVPVDESWNDMVGIVGAMANDWLDVRLSYMEGLVNRDINGVNVINDIKQQFLGLSINLSVDALQVLSEFNNYKRPGNDIQIDTYMMSLGYQIGDFIPHITYSAFEQDINAAGNDEKHYTSTVGVRWDFYRNMALKMQYDKVVDEGVIVPIKGDSNSISLGLDFVF